MLQTTADTLRRLRARSADGSEAARELDRHITALEEGRNERGAGSGT
jgi:hypothetical protein